MDLDTMTFRNAHPNEYVTITCGYDYYEDYKNKMDQMKEIKRMINGLFFDKSDVDTILYEIAQCMCADSGNEKFYLYESRGGSGKGLLTTLVKKSFGDYYGTMDATYFIRNDRTSDANKANDQLADCKYARYVSIPELKENMVIDLSSIKKMTGGDDLIARKGYEFNKDSSKFKAQFKLFFQTNNLFKVDEKSLDRAFKRRFNSRVFPYTFYDEDDPDYKMGEFDKVQDNQLKKRIEDDESTYGLSFFFILLSYFKKLKKLNFKIPISDNFKKNTDDYYKRMDPVGTFMKYMIDNKFIGEDESKYIVIPNLRYMYMRFHSIQITINDLIELLSMAGYDKIGRVNGRQTLKGYYLDQAKWQEYLPKHVWSGSSTTIATDSDNE
jgi:phage/plasmid-associated DNA primase